MERRRFLIQSSFAALSVAALSTFFGTKARAQAADPMLAQAAEPTCPPPATPPLVSSVISRNHGHVLVLSYEEVILGKPQIYNIKGSAGHAHSIELTAEIYAALREQRVVQVESSNDASHTHLVEVRRSEIL